MNATPSAQSAMVSTLLELSTSQSAISDSGEIKATSCPHCSSSDIKANGKLKGVQRYLCKSCCKNFSEQQESSGITSRRRIR